MSTPATPTDRIRTQPGSDGLRRLPGVTIFKAGEHTDMLGRKKTYGRDYLETVARNFAGLRGNANLNLEPPAVLGHEAHQTKLAEILGRTDQLAAGWPDNVRVDGDRLLADLERIPPSVADLIDSGQLRYPSVEFKESLQLDGKPVGPALFRLALLGGTPPGCKTIPPLGHAHFADLPADVIAFADVTGELPGVTSMPETPPPAPVPAPKPAPDPKAELIAFADSLRAEIAQERAALKAELKAEGDAIRAAAQSAAASESARADAAWAGAVDAFCDAESKAGRIAPWELDPKDPTNLRVRLKAIPAAEVLCFADATGEQKKPRRDVELDAIRKRPLRQFGDRLNADTGDEQPITPERRKELLAHTPTGRAILKDEAALNGRGH